MTRIDTLAPIEIDGHRPTSKGNDDHPMRHWTRRIAGLEPGGWNDEARAEVAAFFDTLATEWHTRSSPQRRSVVEDALARGLGPLRSGSGGAAAEIGSGTGFYSPLFAEQFRTVLAVEVAVEMSRRAPDAPAPRVIADGGRLPLPDGSLSAVLLVNAFLFPAEIERVLTIGGVVLWVNSSGVSTPIHLSSADVIEALPFEVEGCEAAAGAGLWTALRRLG